MCELFRGFWIGDYELSRNTEFIKEKKINRILNGYRSFETEEPIDKNYFYVERVQSFIKKAIDIILKAHYLDNENCLIVCKTGNKISLLIAINYLAKISNIDRKRALAIIMTKYEFEYDADFISKFL
jgi:hypothetical protein